jgi:AhpD family alkylhydroperoxidase
MKARIPNPGFANPQAMKGIGTLIQAIYVSGVPPVTLDLTGLRVGQINGCAACVQSHADALSKAGQSPDRIAAVAAWNQSHAFTDTERVALALTDAITRLADRSGESVSDELWEQVMAHYDEQQAGALVLSIAKDNMFTRLNTTVRENPDHPSWQS